jgi:carbon monoxide dehydrogenase subunit G
MRLENTFEVQAAPEAAWALLMDVPRVIPCMPGAELTEVVDASTWKATMSVKLGPISLTFATDVKREESDESARRATLSADARELKGRGSGRATIQSSLTPLDDGGTKVEIVTELTLAGPVAQYGRGIVQDVSAQLVKSFADCLQAQLVAPSQEAEAAVAAQTKPVSGLSLGLRAVGRALARPFRRLFGRHSADVNR